MQQGYITELNFHSFMKQTKFLILLLAACSLSSCWDNTFSDWDVTNVEGLKPIYLDPAVSKAISKETPRDIIDGGVIFSYGNLLLVNDRGLGLHVIDNSDPSAPDFLYFISIPGNYDMSLKGDLLYVDNFNDLVTIKITTTDIEVINRVTGVIEIDNHPRQFGVYFECVDASQGQVIGWEPTNIAQPKCYR